MGWLGMAFTGQVYPEVQIFPEGGRAIFSVPGKCILKGDRGKRQCVGIGFTTALSSPGWDQASCLETHSTLKKFMGYPAEK